MHTHTDRTINLRSRQTIGLCGLKIKTKILKRKMTNKGERGRDRLKEAVKII
jgi:hypothetical protein